MISVVLEPSTNANARRVRREQDVTWGVCLKEQRSFLDTFVRHIHPAYLEGFDALAFPSSRLPSLGELNRRLARTGWECTPVSGFIPAREFFTLQAEQKVPLGNNIRALADAAYSPQPDILHDIFGHAPFCFSPAISELSAKIGRAGLRAPLSATEKEKYAAELALSTLKAAGSRDAAKLLAAEQRALAAKRRTLERNTIFDEIQRVYLWSLEFGLLRVNGEIKILGAGLLSSRAELQRLLTGKTPLLPFDERVLEHEIHFTDYQEQLFLIEDLADVHTLLDRIGAWE